MSIRLRKQVLPAVMATVAACVAPLMMPVASSAAGIVQCHTISKHYAISDGSISIHIGWTDFNVEVCTNQDRITSSSSTTDHDTTGPGEAAGFHLDFYSPVRKTFSAGSYTVPGSVVYATNGRVRDCVPYTTLWCSLSENFQEKLGVHMSTRYWIFSAGYIKGKTTSKGGWFWLNHRRFSWSIRAVNTSSYGAVHFH